MKNKKGFTLVELLAVIAIIAILATISVVSVEGILKSSNNKANEIELESIKAAGRAYALDNLKECSIVCNPTINDLINDGYLDEVKNTDTSKIIYIQTVNKKIKVSFDPISTNFAYTGSIQTYTVPTTGMYKLEVWGAEGGTTTYTKTSTGGKGGYSYGNIKLTSGTKLYIYVGGQGTGATNGTDTLAPGGFNGGGSAYRYAGSTNAYAASGGGATDIRITTDSLYARVIVAGGGGGGGFYQTTLGTGGAGGGTSGIAGIKAYSSYGAGTGGTQTSGGTKGPSSSYSNDGQFGLGGNQTGSSGGWNGCGGGGGFYGGGSGGALGDGGGGGSGYIYTSSTVSNYPSGCLLNSSHYLASASTIAGNTSFTSPNGTNETGHSGNGYARITFVK